VIDSVVARDGIEPPTPAFSGQGTAALIFLILIIFSTFPTTFSTHLLEQ
jgi:hypothetical protein